MELNNQEGLAPEESKSEQKTITIPTDTYEKILGRLERLEVAASKARLAYYDERHRTESPKVICLRSFEGRIVVGWEDMKDNIVEKDPNTGVWVERQTVDLIFEDEKKKKVPYQTWVKHYELVPFEVKKKIIDENEMTIYTLVDKDGHEVTVAATFIN